MASGSFLASQTASQAAVFSTCSRRSDSGPSYGLAVTATAPSLGAEPGAKGGGGRYYAVTSM